MRIEIKLKEQEVSISLKDGKNMVDSVIFKLEHNLTEKLLPVIDQLLRRNNLEPGDLEKTKLVSELSKSYTSARIAQSVTNALNWAKIYKNN